MKIIISIRTERENRDEHNHILDETIILRSMEPINHFKQMYYFEVEKPDTEKHRTFQFQLKTKPWSLAKKVLTHLLN